MIKDVTDLLHLQLSKSTDHSDSTEINWFQSEISVIINDGVTEPSEPVVLEKQKKKHS